MKRVVTVPMPPSTSFPVRQVTLVRVRVRPLIGVLEIRESRTPEGKKKISRYAVREDKSSDDDRVFRLVKPIVEGGGHYFVCLAADSARFHQCECQGFESAGNCKHIQAMTHLIDAEV